MTRALRALLTTLLILPYLMVSAYEKIDTITTTQNDKVIIRYSVNVSDGNITIRFNGTPRVIPSSQLRKACKENLDNIKVVVFDKIGDYHNVKWTGIAPSAFMVPAGLSYDKNNDGYYILGETQQPLTFHSADTRQQTVDLPIYVGVYEKKRQYRLYSTGRVPLQIKCYNPAQTKKVSPVVQGMTETVVVPVDVDDEENTAIVNALGSIDMIKQMLASTYQLPFSQSLQMEIYNLRSLKNKITDAATLARINEVLLETDNKERELTNQQNAAMRAEQARADSIANQIRLEDEQRQAALQAEAQQREEKQQKRTLWMIIGGALLAIFGFIGNALFKHFRDLRQQRSFMEMQQSLTRQAQGEIGRRSQEIVRNKVHRAVNQGQNAVRKRITLQSNPGSNVRPSGNNNSPQSNNRPQGPDSTQRNTGKNNQNKSNNLKSI